MNAALGNIIARSNVHAKSTNYKSPSLPYHTCLMVHRGLGVISAVHVQDYLCPPGNISCIAPKYVLPLGKRMLYLAANQ